MAMDFSQSQKIRFQCIFELIALLLWCIHHQTALAQTEINTDTTHIKHGTAVVANGTVESKIYICKNNYTWVYEVAVFNIFENDSNTWFTSSGISVTGSRALEINVQGNLIINFKFDLSGVSLNRTSSKPTYLGGFALRSTNCCYVGAGPGAAFTYHGGANGGDGGGSWKDWNTNISYGTAYTDRHHLLGGSTGAILYDSDPGSGGGAIALNVNGTLKIESTGSVQVNGFTSPNTTFPACSGGSAGGAIIIKAFEVVLSGRLNAKGGNSGITSNYSHYCGDGGGGGNININAIKFSEDVTVRTDVSGGLGFEAGKDGRKMIITHFVKGEVVINTTVCSLTSTDLPGILYGTLNDLYSGFTVCYLEFKYTIRFAKNVNVNVFGKNALSITSISGHIIIKTNLNLDGKHLDVYSYNTYLGGYHSYKDAADGYGPGSHNNYAAHGNSTRDNSYGINPVELKGGSVCKKKNSGAGGGALELKALLGNIIIGGKVSANAFIEGSFCGSSGGTIRVIANKTVVFEENGRVEARGAASGGSGYSGDGGVVEIRAASTHNAKSKVDVSGGINGTTGLDGTFWDPDNPAPSIAPVVMATTYAPGMSSTPSLASTATILKSHSDGGSRSSIDIFKTNSTLETSFQTLIDPSTSQSVVEATSSISLIDPSTSESIVQATSSISRCVKCKMKETVSPQFKMFENVTVEPNNALNISSQINKALNNTENMTKSDVKIIMEILGQVCNSSVFASMKKNESRSVAKNVLSSYAHVAEIHYRKNDHQYGEKEIGMDLIPRITTDLEDLGNGIGKSLGTADETILFIKNGAFSFEVNRVTTKTYRSSPLVLPITNHDEVGVDTLDIPSEDLSDIKDPIIFTIVLVNITGLYKKSLLSDGKDVTLGSNILAVSTNVKFKNTLQAPITLKLHLNTEVNQNMTAKCGFWKVFKSNKSGRGWSYDGCSSTVEENVVTSKCNHMTNFAVLMQVKEFEIDEKHLIPLKLITYIGCAISLLGLLLTFGTFVSIQTLASDRTIIHTNLVVALGIAQIIFLSGAEAVSNKIACTCIAILLHYFFTAAFSWMFAEGIHLYSKVVSVFTQGSRMRFYYVIGWGLPAVIVALSAGIKPGGYGTDTVCWISIDGGLKWVFVAPVLVVILINCIVMVSVVKILMSSIDAVQPKEDGKCYIQVKAGVKAMAILMPILGLTWTFGLLAVNQKTIVFQYIFCILNSLQGLFIFLLHCVGNSEVRAAVRRMHEKHTLSKSIGEKSSVPKVQDDEEIVVRRHIDSAKSVGRDSLGTPHKDSLDGISLNSINMPMVNGSFEHSEEDRKAKIV